MNMNRRAMTRIGLLVASVLVGAGILFVETVSRAQVAPPPAPAVDMAWKITLLVQNGKTDELAHLAIPTSDAQMSRLKDWTTEYLSQVSLQEKQRDKQYAEAVSKAQEQLKS